MLTLTARRRFVKSHMSRPGAPVHDRYPESSRAWETPLANAAAGSVAGPQIPAGRDRNPVQEAKSREQPGCVLTRR